MSLYKEEQYQISYAKHNWSCQVCGNPANQIAHLIPQRKWLIEKYGERVINHNDNLLPACSLKCNDKLQLSQWQWEKKAEQIKKIIEN